MGWFANWKERRRVKRAKYRHTVLMNKIAEVTMTSLASGGRVSIPQDLFSSPDELQAFLVRLRSSMNANIRADSSAGLVFVYNDDVSDGLEVTVIGVRQ